MTDPRAGCAAVREHWSRRVPPATQLVFGPDEASSDEPAARRLRERGAHFYWVATAVGGLAMYDAHVGIVVDPSSETARAGFHISRASEAARQLLDELGDGLALLELEACVAEAADEAQWNRPAHRLAEPAAIERVCAEATALLESIDSRLRGPLPPMRAPRRPDEGGHV